MHLIYLCVSWCAEPPCALCSLPPCRSLCLKVQPRRIIYRHGRQMLSDRLARQALVCRFLVTVQVPRHAVTSQINLCLQAVRCGVVSISDKTVRRRSYALSCNASPLYQGSQGAFQASWCVGRRTWLHVGSAHQCESMDKRTSPSILCNPYKLTDGYKWPLGRLHTRLL